MIEITPPFSKAFDDTLRRQGCSGSPFPPGGGMWLRRPNLAPGERTPHCDLLAGIATDDSERIRVLGFCPMSTNLDSNATSLYVPDDRPCSMT